MSNDSRARQLFAAIRAEHPDMPEEELRAALGIIEAVGLEEIDDQVERAERFASRIANIVVELVDQERRRRGLPPLKA